KGKGNSDIEEQISEIYGFDVSTSTISRITDRITNDIVAWQNRPLEPVYLIVCMDGIVFKVREGGQVINKTVHIAGGLGREGGRCAAWGWPRTTRPHTGRRCPPTSKAVAPRTS